MTDLEQQHAAYRQKPGVCDGCAKAAVSRAQVSPRERNAEGLWMHWHGEQEVLCTALPILEYADQQLKAKDQELRIQRAEYAKLDGLSEWQDKAVVSQSREIAELREGLHRLLSTKPSIEFDVVIANARDLLSRTGEPQEKPSSENLTTNADTGTSERKS